MTTDIKPVTLAASSVAAFTEAMRGPKGTLDAWLEDNNEAEVRAHVEAYTRANVAHATAAKDAEIERLRAEVGQEQDYAAGAARRVLMAQIAQRRAEARVERLAEALRLIAAPIRPDGTWNRDREACRQIARDALRDHDQEGGNP